MMTISTRTREPVHHFRQTSTAFLMREIATQLRFHSEINSTFLYSRLVLFFCSSKIPHSKQPQKNFNNENQLITIWSQKKKTLFDDLQLINQQSLIQSRLQLDFYLHSKRNTLHVKLKLRHSKCNPARI